METHTLKRFKLVKGMLKFLAAFPYRALEFSLTHELELISTLCVPFNKIFKQPKEIISSILLSCWWHDESISCKKHRQLTPRAWPTNDSETKSVRTHTFYQHSCRNNEQNSRKKIEQRCVATQTKWTGSHRMLPLLYSVITFWVEQ